MTTRRTSLLPGLLLIFVVPAVWALIHPPVFSFGLAHGERLLMWASPALRRATPWLATLLMGFSVVGWTSTRRMMARVSSDGESRWLYVLRPLVWLPACAGMSQWGILLELPLLDQALVLGLILLPAWSLDRFLGPLTDRTDRLPGRPVRGFLWYGLFLLLLGLYFNHRVGEDVGDEAHYMTQLHSLRQDADLNVENNLSQDLAENPAERRRDMTHMHLVESPRGRIFSYHSFGLPLLGWPLAFAGFFGRQLLLALIGTGALAGCWRLCREAGAARRAVRLTLLVLGFSYAWAVYAIRFLPEILGCGLLAWAFWGFMAQRRRPWLTMAVTLAACGYLPYAHTRFAVPSLLVALCYGLRGLWLREPLRLKLVRLGLFTLGYAICGLALMGIQHAMFGDRGAYDYGGILFSYPRAMWAVLADERGLLSVLPAAAWMLAATLVACFQHPKFRIDGLAAGVVTAGILVTSCSNSAALGGACIPGRYLLTAVPLLLPGTALMMSKARGGARIMFYSLGLTSFLLLLATLITLRGAGGTFILPWHRLQGMKPFNALINPLLSYRNPPWPGAEGWTTLVVLAGLLLALLSLSRRLPQVPRFLAAGACLAAMILGALKAHEARPAIRHSRHQLLHLELTNRVFERRPSQAPRRDLFAAFEAEAAYGERPPQQLTTRDLGNIALGLRYSQPRIPVNDWNGRGYRWHTMHPHIRTNRDGGLAIQLQGRLEGTAKPCFAMRQGAHTLEETRVNAPEGPLKITWLVPTRRGRGFVEPLVRLENGEGMLRIDKVLVVPWTPALKQGGRFVIEPDSLVLPSAGCDSTLSQHNDY